MSSVGCKPNLLRLLNILSPCWKALDHLDFSIGKCNKRNKPESSYCVLTLASRSQCLYLHSTSPPSSLPHSTSCKALAPYCIAFYRRNSRERVTLGSATEEGPRITSARSGILPSLSALQSRAATLHRFLRPNRCKFRASSTPRLAVRVPLVQTGMFPRDCGFRGRRRDRPNTTRARFLTVPAEQSIPPSTELNRLSTHDSDCTLHPTSNP